jgi:RNase P subunit RPR2
MTFETEHISLTCPSCGAVNRYRIAWVQEHRHSTCNACRTIFQIDKDSATLELARAELESPGFHNPEPCPELIGETAPEKRKASPQRQG